MSISLRKGGTLSLSKDNPGLAKVFMGLGWDAAKPKGFLGKIFSGAPKDIDLDASVILFDVTKAALDAVWFRQLQSRDGSIRHSGDNRTGDGDGDDETIRVDLAHLPDRVVHLVFTVNSFLGQTFDKVENASCRLVDEKTGREICRYDLAEKGEHTGVIMASLSKGADGWTMTAHGVPCSGRTVGDMMATAARLLP